jgi:glutamine amidotransferase
MICIVDYGAGNLRSVQKAIEHFGAQTMVSSSPKEIEKAAKVVLPGVGAFGKAVEAIDRLELRESLVRVILQQKPFLGICLGMQLLFAGSEENPEAAGLGVLPGSVVRFPKNLKVPHLGWNALQQVSASPLWGEIPAATYFYFAHSYYVLPEDSSVTIGASDYSFDFPVAIQKENLFGLQFHPEKSQRWGLQILQNFIALR